MADVWQPQVKKTTIPEPGLRFKEPRGSSTRAALLVITAYSRKERVSRKRRNLCCDTISTDKTAADGCSVDSNQDGEVCGKSVYLTNKPPAATAALTETATPGWRTPNFHQRRRDWPTAMTFTAAESSFFCPEESETLGQTQRSWRKVKLLSIMRTLFFILSPHLQVEAATTTVMVYNL